MPETSYDQHKHEGLVRTDLYCHECGKNFIAELDYDIDGNHVIECPHCGHEHCRVIKNGTITSDRWDGRNDGKSTIRTNRVWKHNVLQAKTSSASAFLRHRWLNLDE